jgi:hypothetical protein
MGPKNPDMVFGHHRTTFRLARQGHNPGQIPRTVIQSFDAIIDLDISNHFR